MAQLTAEQVTTVARQAGFTGAALVTAVAVARAESGWRPDAIGDVNLTEAGERSVGLWQINYRPSRDAGSATRDPTANLDPARNAAAAYALSGGGRNFRPWTTYTRGTYKPFTGDAQSAANAVEGAGGGRLGLTGINPPGKVDNPVNNAVGAVVGVVAAPIKSTADAIGKLGELAAALLSGATWQRLGLILGGVLVMGLGVTLINRDAIGAALAKGAVAV